MSKLLIINFHGGFPSCYIEAAFERLPAFKKIASVSQLHTRAYATNSIASCSLHDMIMDAPLCTMIDSCWHSWCKTTVPQRSIFHILKNAGFNTQLLGAFGIEPSFDPHNNMSNYPFNIENELRNFGIDKFDTEDAAFTCRMSLSHDQSILEKTLATVERWEQHEKQALMVNLLACNDIHKLSWSSSINEAYTPSLPENRWMEGFSLENISESFLSECQLNDDPRSYQSSEDKMSNGLMRSAMLNDYLKGEKFEPLSKDRLLRVLNILHKYTWKTLVHLDTMLQPIIDNVIDNGINMIMFSDHAVSMYEHGMRCESPWEGCNRSFLLLKNDSKIESRSSVPCSLSILPFLIMKISITHTVDWRVPIVDMGNAFTVSIAPSSLCKANLKPMTNAFSLPFMWCRAVVTFSERIYSIVFWWSIDDMIASTEKKEIMSPMTYETIEEKSMQVSKQKVWILPLTTPSAIFDITTNSTEVENLMRLKDWIWSDEYTKIMKITNAVIRQYGFSERVKINIPANCHKIFPDEVSVCSIQVRPKMLRRDQVTTRSIGMQTENAVHFATTPHSDPPTRTSPRKKTPMKPRPPLPPIVSNMSANDPVKVSSENTRTRDTTNRQTDKTTLRRLEEQRNLHRRNK